MWIKVFGVGEPEDGGAGRDGSVESRWVLHSEPRCEHATVGATEHVDWRSWVDVFRVFVVAALALDFLKKRDIVHHDLFYGKILQVLWLHGNISRVKWIRFTVVSVLAEDDGGVHPLGKCSCHKSRIIVKALDGALITGVEEDGSSLIWIELLVNDVSECEGWRGVVSGCIEMVEACLERYWLWALVISLHLL